MKLSPHNKLIKKLIDQGLSDREIQTEIRKVFNMSFKISDIQNKRTSELNDLIKPFRPDAIELLYPILYKGFPDRNFIKDKLEQIINYLIDAIKVVEGFPTEDVLIDLLLVFEEGLNTYKHDAFLYRLIYQYKKENKQELEDSRAVKQLKVQIKNPFKYYFSLSNINMEHLSFREDSPEFDHIVREVCRDNVITKKERAYLEEKAAEYFIELDKLDRYLDNPFLGHETFKIFVDQICEDGIVTETEKEYINEKAKQYNVPVDLLKKMVSTGLLRAHFKDQLAQDNDFYEIVLIYLFANSFGLKTVEQRLSSMLRTDPTGHTISEQLKTKKNLLFDVFCKEVSEKKELESLQIENFANINEVFDVINIKPVSLAQLIEISSKENNNEEKVAQELITLEWSYTFDPELEKPIHINYLNKKVILKNENGAFNTFLNSLFLERNKHRSPELDLFFENFEEFYNEL